MKTATFRYHEALVEDGDLVEIHDTVLLGAPQLFSKTTPRGCKVYIAWLSKEDEREDRQSGS